ncbi:MAG: superoxide dismutase [Syntrophales bacterium]|jgi:Fe-Mn family superoxide dismutase|nr:superoxide dismutase [Syntrophales bacterium]MDY0043491.1 superoxide dismutase [Syntrophales bacterium]
MIERAALPYEKNALEPFIGSKTVEFHYEKHHATYVSNANAKIEGTEFERLDITAILEKTFDDTEKKAIFNNVAQAWNHSFYWQCMKPGGGGSPRGEIASMIDSAFGNYSSFLEKIKTAAAGQFGSGWAWLVLKNGNLQIVTTSNADTPIAHGMKPLLTIDVWEHAYYLDYQNRRADYLSAFMNSLINWEFVERCLEE